MARPAPRSAACLAGIRPARRAATACVLGLLASALPACVSGAADEPGPPPAGPSCDPAYALEFQAWRTLREEQLRSPDGYLALSGLHWLREGNNVVGSDPASDVVLDEGRAPGRVGVLFLHDGEASLSVEPGATVTFQGRPVHHMALQTDAAGRSTELSLGELSFTLIDRGGRVALRVRDPRSAVLAAYAGTPSWPPQDAWRVPGRFLPDAVPRLIEVPNVLGGSYPEESQGTLLFELFGQVHDLVVTGRSGEDLFVVFGDDSNGEGSHLGGRFLRVAAPDELSRVVIDFNRAYNPPCAYSPYTTCPLPPPGNILPFAVTAGEMAVEPAAGP